MFFEGFHTSITITGDFPAPVDDLHVFHWHTHIPLPFPLPTEKCIHFDAQIGSRLFEFGIHGHFDEIRLQKGTGKQTTLIVGLCDKKQSIPETASGSRRSLKSVAKFDEKAEYKTINEAMAGAKDKFDECIKFLRSYLVKLQSFAPFNCSWLLYPLTIFDLDDAFHSVIARNKHTNVSKVVVSLPIFFVAGGSQTPLFQMEVPGPNDAVDPLLATPYELLAEGLLSIARGLPRSGVVNSYNALEVFAYSIHRKLYCEVLVSQGVSTADADEKAEKERKEKDRNLTYFFHDGMKKINGRSLQQENRHLFQELWDLKPLRNQVVHHGLQPTIETAHSAHKTCCLCLAWIAKVAGLTVKPYSAKPIQNGVVMQLSTGGTALQLCKAETSDGGSKRPS